MISQPLISVLIPVLNREKYLKDSLDSVLNQTYSNWECIVVDDGSNDRTLEIVEGFCEQDWRFRLIKRPLNLPAGSATCRNLALECAKGKFLNFLDSDDTLKPDCLEKKVLKFLKNEELDIVISKSIINNKINGEIKFEHRTKNSNNLIEDYILRIVSWYIDNPMIRKNFLNEGHKFSTFLKGGQDRDFFIKILIDTPKIEIIDFYGSTYNRHVNSISGIMYQSSSLNSVYNYSHYEALINQTFLLKERAIFNDRLRAFYFQEILKKFPSVHRTKNSKLDFYKKLINLTNFNFAEIISWIKLFLSHISFILIGKGERFLK